MMVWRGEEPSEQEFSRLVEVLTEEIAASRTLHELLNDTRGKKRKKFALLHRPLEVTE
jgi:hypothetical protein